MMPPKKSKAARAATEEENIVPPPLEYMEPPKNDENTEVKDASAPEPKRKMSYRGAEVEEDSNDDEEMSEVNIFKTELMDGKRQRVAPAGKQMLEDWIAKHLEAKDDSYLPKTEVYNIYLENCIASNTYAVEVSSFIKTIRDMFPKGFAIRADSPYHDAVKQKKKPKERKKSTQVKASSLNLKMRDILKEAFMEAGNPEHGLRFNTLKKMVNAKYPALQVDLRPGMFKAALQRAVYHGTVYVTKGVGMCGFYRWYVEGEKKMKLKEEKKESEANEEGEKKDVEKPAENGFSEGEEKTEDESKEKTDEEGQGDEKKADHPAKKQRKKSKKKSKKTSPLKHIIHSEPQKVEDTFFMAMTYMSDPKETSVARIKKYILDHYKNDISIDKLRKVLQTGSEKGFWEQVSGTSASQGSYRLLLTEFDPTDDDLMGMITNAIMASHEPKQCSAAMLKRYIVKYHPKFKVAERPNLLKKAIERALEKNIIKRLSGIGVMGSFQLTKPFIPNPIVLSGEDTPDDYIHESSEDEESEVEHFAEGFKLSQFQDAYKPRPTKRHARAASKGSLPSENQVVGRFRSSTVKTEPKRAASQGSHGKSKRQKKNRISYVELDEDEHTSSEEEEEEVIEVKPKKSPKKSKAAAGKKRKAPPPKKKAAPKKAKRTSSGSPKKTYLVSSDEEEVEVIETPKKVQTKAAKKAPPTPTSAKSKKKKKTLTKSPVVHLTDIHTKPEKSSPKKNKSASKPKSLSRVSPRKSFVNYTEDDLESDDEVVPKSKKAKGKGKKKKGKVSQG